MANQYLSMETLNFLMYQVHEVEKLLTAERFVEYDKESINSFLDSMKAFADKDLFPYFEDMDAKPAYFKDGTIIVHPQLKTIIEKGTELGLVGANFDYEVGGMQLPETVLNVLCFIAECANNSASGYLGLTAGSCDLIATFGSQELKDRFVPKMLGGEWGGTMCLTEPQAGSSLSDVSTSATPTDNDFYHIKGQKIFISGGDHAYYDNFVHLVLGRIDGAPRGTKGISLFVVPKNRRLEDGSFEYNDVATAADFQKLGQKGYCTTHLVFGDNEDCRGWLVGEANKGLKYMFQMMNGARIAVGRGGTAIATAAYYASLEYARERPQGRKINNAGEKDVSSEQTLIINHPDVKRMLYLQKAVAEGGLSLVLQTSMYHDLEKISTGEEKENYHLLLELLTPMCKTYPSEMGIVSVSNGVQVLGGYGFCQDFVLQQYYRDIRIFSLYEGTTGIQSLDLLGRKITSKNGKAAQLFAMEITKTIKEASQHEELGKYAQILGEKLKLSQEVLSFLAKFAMKGDFQRYLSDATIFMEFLGTVTIGWQWLKMALSAQKSLNANSTEQSTDFYTAKIQTMKFYFKYEIPKTTSLANVLMNEEVLTVEKEDKIIFD